MYIGLEIFCNAPSCPCRNPKVNDYYRLAHHPLIPPRLTLLFILFEVTALSKLVKGHLTQTFYFMQFLWPGALPYINRIDIVHFIGAPASKLLCP